MDFDCSFHRLCRIASIDFVGFFWPIQPSKPNCSMQQVFGSILIGVSNTDMLVKFQITTLG